MQYKKTFSSGYKYILKKIQKRAGEYYIRGNLLIKIVLGLANT
jgi:hypothetical protein